MALLNFPDQITVVLGSHFNSPNYYGLAEDDTLTLTKGTGSIGHSSSFKNVATFSSAVWGSFPQLGTNENVTFWSEDGTLTPSSTNRLVFIPQSSNVELYFYGRESSCSPPFYMNGNYAKPIRARVHAAKAATPSQWFDDIILARNIAGQTGDYNFKDLFSENLATDVTAIFNVSMFLALSISDGALTHTATFTSLEGSFNAHFPNIFSQDNYFARQQYGSNVSYNPGIFKFMDEATSVSASFSATPLSGIAPLSVSFQDLSTSGVTSWLWDFGDGETSTEQNPTHIYEESNEYSVVLTINGGSDSETKVNYINVYASNSCYVETDYITLCGPESELMGRFGECKSINLKEFIPNYLRESETEDLVVLFEDFLNEMFQGSCGWLTSANELVITQNWTVLNSASNSGVSGDVQLSSTYDLSGNSFSTESLNVEQIEIHYPSQANLELSARRISVLEKIARLTELHDPDLIDLDFIQFFASNLGYNVEIARNEIGGEGDLGLTEFGGVCGNEDINKYLRFVVRNLPTWYKIKSTNNAIKVMLYSFGLVADLKQYFTNNYLQSNEIDEYKENGSWILDKDEDFSKIRSNWIPTPHFVISVNFDESSDISFDIVRRSKAIKAVDSIRPVNTVFRNLEAFVNRNMELKFGAYLRSSRYTVIESNGKSNGWA